MLLAAWCTRGVENFPVPRVRRREVWVLGAGFSRRRLVGAFSFHARVRAEAAGDVRGGLSCLVSVFPVWRRCAAFLSRRLHALVWSAMSPRAYPGGKPSGKLSAISNDGGAPQVAMS